MNIDIGTILSWITLANDHKYKLLALCIAVPLIGWMTALTSDWSRFPVNVPARWQPAIAAGLGLVYAPSIAMLAAAKAGHPVLPALLGSIEGGVFAAAMSAFLYDLVIKGICNGKVPSWLAFLALARKPGVNPPDPRAITVPPATPRTSLDSRSRAAYRVHPLVRFAAVGIMMTFLAACSALQGQNFVFPDSQTILCASKDVDQGIVDPIKIVQDCPKLGSVAATDLQALIDGLFQAKLARDAKAKNDGGTP